MSKYSPGIRVLRVIPIREDDSFLVWLKIGPLTIRDVKFRPSSGDIGWPSKGSGTPIVQAPKNCSERVLQKITEYLASHEIRRAFASDLLQVERFCLYCHKSVKPGEHTRGNNHKQCLANYDRDLKTYAANLVSRIGKTNADQWLRRKQSELRKSLEHT